MLPSKRIRAVVILKQRPQKQISSKENHLACDASHCRAGGLTKHFHEKKPGTMLSLHWSKV